MWQSLIWPLLLLFGAAKAGWAEERLLTREVASKFLNAKRTVRIYLPASYYQQPTRHYPVLYLHDGQNLFSSAGTNICFGWGNWELDKTADEFCRTGKLQEILLVAIYNSSARYEEYCGRHRSINASANTEFENYTSFLIQELKPKIDSEYRSRPEPANTGLMGSSMGGICSIVLAWEPS
jgi:predicted alpha/beta superfamily hydrolase